MEVNVTKLMLTDHTQFSNSIARSGREDVAAFTWKNAKEWAADNPLLSNPAEVTLAKDYFRTFGAWSDEEIADWSDNDVNALIVQSVSGDRKEEENGRLYEGDDGEWYYYVGE